MLRKLLGLSALLVLLAACTQPGAPSVTATLTPTANATNVSIDTDVSVVFSGAMNGATLVEGALTLASADGEVAGDFEYIASERRATFTPSEALDYDTEYTATLAGTVRSGAGGRVTGTTSGSLSWAFVTEAEPVVEPEVTAVAVAPATLALEAGDTGTLTATVTATGGADESVTWGTSNPAVANVANGVVTAVGAGTATITATSVFNTAVSGSATVTVTEPVEPAVTGVAVTPATTDDLEIDGAPVVLTANVTAVGGASEAVTWSSSDVAEAIVEVEDNGDGTATVTAVGAGTATITATSDFDGTVSGSATVTVLAPAITSVTVSTDTPAVLVGETAQFTADVQAVSGAPMGVVWSSSDPTVATVDPDTGEATAVAAGTADIIATATFDGTTGLAVLTVADAPAVTDVSIAPADTDDLEIGGAPVVLTATVTAAGGAIETVTWSSSDEAGAIVEVEDNGDGTVTVTAVAAGTATITATSDFDDTVSGSATVTVLAPAVISITVDPDEALVEVGDDVTLEATVVVVSDESTAVTWTSNDPTIATVVEGVVTAVAPGTATITATSVDPAHTVDATINVPGVTAVAVSPATAELAIGGTATLTAAVTALHGADDSVTWSSSNDAVATVVGGVVTGVAAGTADITATSVADGTVAGSAEVTVYGPLVIASHWLFTPEDLEAGGDPINLPLGVSGGAAPYSFSITTTAPAGFPEDYDDVPYDDMEEIGELRLPPGDIAVDSDAGALVGTHDSDDFGYYAFLIEVTDSVGQVEYIFVELDLEQPLTLTYENAEYTYPGGCGALTIQGRITCLSTGAGGTTFTVGSGPGSENYRSIFPISHVVIQGATAGETITYSMERQTPGLSDSRWAINSTNGVIGRRNNGGQNTSGTHNSDRTYLVTATESGTGRTATFTIEFIED